MKHTLFPLLAVGLVSTMSSQAAILFKSSDFSYTAGNIAGQNGWVAHSGTGNSVQVDVDGIITLNQGSGSREDVNVPFAAIGAGQTYYYGFDVVVSGGSTDVYFAHFKNAGTGTDFTTRLFVTSFGGSDFTFGLSPAASAPDVTWATGLDFATSYRIIGSYNNDTQLTQMWVNPTNSASTSISFTDPASAAVAAFAFRQASGDSTQAISNVVVGTSFDETLAAVPEPTAAVLGFLGLLGLLRRRR